MMQLEFPEGNVPGYGCNHGSQRERNTRGTRYSRCQTCKALPSVEEHSYGKRTEEPGVARKSLSRVLTNVRGVDHPVTLQ